MPGGMLGPYRLVSELGSGGMGTVWRAEVVGEAGGLAPGATVALKVIHPHLLDHAGALERFLREAEIGRRIRHRNVVATLDVGATERDGRTVRFLVLEYVDGGQTLRSLQEELGRVPERLCRHIGREAARGLAAVHAAGVVHRDVKPENVLITREHVVKVMDLGVAKPSGEALRISQTGAFIGSPRYAAPEQFRGGGAGLDGRADLYALGAVLYELACGRHPVPGDDFASVVEAVLHSAPRRLGEANPQVSPFFEEVVHTLLAKDRGARFAAADEVAHVFDEAEASSWWAERAAALRTASDAPLRRVRIPRDTALHGRDEEIARLRALFARARSGEGAVLLLEGDAGIGKSRLVDEFAALLRCEGEQFHFLHGSYPPAGVASASGAFGTAYREQFGGGSLDEALRRHLPGTPLLAPAFAALLRGDAVPPGTEPLTRDSLQTCFVEATRSLAAERTTIVLADDLQFAPPEGRALFAALALSVPGHRVLLVGATRPTDDAWHAPLVRAGLVRMKLAPLGPDAVVALLAEAFRSEALARDLAAQISVESAGNPLFVFEVLRALRERGILRRREDGTWSTTRLHVDIPMPASVHELVMSRCAALTEEERDLLDAASCLGVEFDPLVLASALGLARIPLLKRLASIERRHRLVRSAGARFVFDPHLVQEALYSALPELLRREYHAAVAAAIEERSGSAGRDLESLDGGLCAELAEHFLRGTDGGRGLRYLPRALDHLAARSLNDTAVRVAELALATPGLVAGPERCRLLLRRAERLGILGRAAEERAAVDEALALADADLDAGLRAHARTRLGSHLHGLSRDAEAAAALSEAVDLSRAAGDRVREATASGLLGLALDGLGRYEEARASHERQFVLSREEGDRAGEAIALANIASLAIAVGRHDEALEMLERDIALLRETRSRRATADSLGNLAVALQEMGRFEEASVRHEEALAVAREIGYRRLEAVGNGNLGNVHRALGRLRDALSRYERQIALAREIGYRRGECIAHINFADARHLLGRLDEARSDCERHLDIAREIGFRRGESYALARLGLIEADRGETAEGRRLLEAALAMRRRLGQKEAIADALASLGGVLGDAGRRDDARARLEEALTVAGEAGASPTSALAACRLAVLPGGDAGAARESLLRHAPRMEHAARMEARFLVWRAGGDAADLAEAKALLAHLVEHAPPEDRESTVANVPLHRAIAAAS